MSKDYDCTLQCRPVLVLYRPEGATAWAVRRQFGMVLRPFHLDSCITKAVANDEVQPTVNGPLGPVLASQSKTSYIGNTMPEPVTPALTIILPEPSRAMKAN